VKSSNKRLGIGAVSCACAVFLFSARVSADDLAGTHLPHGLAPWEVGLPLPVADAPFAPPAGEVLTPAEYARNQGLLLRWGAEFDQFHSVVRAIAVAITTLDPDGIVTLVIDGEGDRPAAETYLAAGGVDLSQVEFLVAPSDSVWIRDYGPRFILEDKQLAIVDHVYNRSFRPQDDAIPVAFASAWTLARYDIPLVHGGGNFHLFQDGDAFMTELILDENPSLSELEVRSYFEQYQNLDVTIFPGFPTSFDSTRHIDMWMLPVRDKVVIIGEYPAAAGAPYTITENAVTDLQARGYTVHRTPGWRAGGTHFTYANALVFNKVVLVPQYNAYPTQNAQAIAVFQQAFPGKAIVGIDGSQIVQSAGVFHCIVMHVPDPRWIFEDDFETQDASVWSFVTPP
jgi:agmatine deiminase